MHDEVVAYQARRCGDGIAPLEYQNTREHAEEKSYNHFARRNRAHDGKNDGQDRPKTQMLDGLHSRPLYGKRGLSQAKFLDPSNVSALEQYAKRQNFLTPTETLVSATKAGEGNMNLTLRLTTDTRTLILKQARPWVEKYPQIPAPDSRALVEIAFYEITAKRRTLRDAMPKLLASDSEARVLVLEDLGVARDFTSLYAGERLADTDLEALVSYLAVLHQPWNELPRIFANREMRALNHEHIFRLPLAPNNGIGLDGFTPGLQAVAETLKNDFGYVERVAELGELYLSDGASLVHGDYFPGSWLRTPDGVRIIDPEFCFVGPAAFDVGVMVGHLYLANHSEELTERVISSYGADVGTAALARQFAGVEIMRRLIGVAQLPLDVGIETKIALVELSRKLVLSA